MRTLLRNLLINIRIKQAKLTDELLLEITRIRKDKKLFKKYAPFLYQVIKYNIRKGNNTKIQLDALRRIK